MKRTAKECCGLQSSSKLIPQARNAARITFHGLILFETSRGLRDWIKGRPPFYMGSFEGFIE
jgi:hypothetical protein